VPVRARLAAALFLLMGCSTPSPETAPDAAISARVRSALSSAGISPGYPMRIHTTNGVVRLSGFAHDGTQQSRAATIAAETEGVLAVENHLVIMPRRGNPHSRGGSGNR
jgi:osmotically-inducible protein OsmY